jgi:hypothetical protein
MPIRIFLGGHRFDDETVRLMGLAFEMALAALRHDCPDPLREALAGKIIELGKVGERDPERLCDDALKSLRLKVSDPSPLPPRASPPVPPGSSS